MRYLAFILVTGGCLFGQTLEPLQRFDNSVGPAPYFNPAQETLKRSVKRALPSRRSAIAPVLDHVLPPLGDKMPDGTIIGARGAYGLMSKKSPLNDWLFRG